LEQFEANSTLQRVEADIARLDANVTELAKWRQLAETDWQAWRDRVANAFKNMSQALDLKHLEEEDEQASEKFAVQQAINHLTTHFNDELSKMSEDARSVLIKFTADAGTKIHELMKNDELDQTQKARVLAEIKEELRVKALSVLRGGFASRLNNAALERKLRSAASTVESAVRQMSDIYNPGGNLNGNVIGRMLKELTVDVAQAGSDADAQAGWPSALLERTNSGSVAADRDLAERDTRLESALLAILSRRDAVKAAKAA